MRRIIPMPRFRKEVTASDLESKIYRSLQQYYQITPAARVSFFLNNIISEARFKGRLTPSAEQKHEPLPASEPVRLILTCSACPEQYVAYLGQKMVGYLRLRHGRFTVQCPDVGGMTVYRAQPRGDGSFDDDERDYFLRFAVDAILHWVAGGEPAGQELPAPDVSYEVKDDE